RDAPVGLEQLGLARGRDRLEAVTPVEADRPLRRGPGADQHAARAQAAQMTEQHAADAAPLAARQDIGVTDEIDVTHRLGAHDAEQPVVLLMPPEHDPGGDLAIELVARHVGLVPAVGRDHPAVGLSGGVDDREYGGALVATTGADHAHDAILLSDWYRASPQPLIPAQAGIQDLVAGDVALGPRFRGDERTVLRSDTGLQNRISAT